MILSTVIIILLALDLILHRDSIATSHNYNIFSNLRARYKAQN